MLSTRKDVLQVEVHNHETGRILSTPFSVDDLAEIATLETSKNWYTLSPGIIANGVRYGLKEAEDGKSLGSVGLGFTAHSILSVVTQLPELTARIGIHFPLPSFIVLDTSSSGASPRGRFLKK